MSKHRRKFKKYILIKTIEQLRQKILTEYPKTANIDRITKPSILRYKDVDTNETATILTLMLVTITDPRDSTDWSYYITVTGSKLAAIWASNRPIDWNKYDAPILNKFLSKYRWAGLCPNP